MESYDQLMRELNVQKLIDRINALGYNSTSSSILTVSKCLSENLAMLSQFT